MLDYITLEECPCGCTRLLYLHRVRGVDEEGNPVDEVRLECMNCGQQMRYDLMSNGGDA